MDFTVIDNPRATSRRERGLYFNRLLRIMKLTVFIMFITCMQVCANGYGQTISLSETHAPLNEVFRKIQRQSGYLFWYNDDLLANARKVDIKVTNATLQQVLDICFFDQPFTYEIMDKMVVLKTKPITAVKAAENPNPQTDIHGRVTDSLGNSLAGASVTIKGTNKGTTTNAKGEFDMKDVPSGIVLVISYTGYTNKEVPLSNGISQIHIVLQQSQDILDATVIQAYGTTSRRFSVGSISSVDAATIEKQPVSNVLLALEGQVPGLAINASSGVPGSRVQLQIRGQNTIMSGGYFKPYDQPLFIVDGVPFAPQNNNTSLLSSLATGQSFNGGISQFIGLSPFNSINPADIESISVLKDADATSIYGTQGSNGVILITTKKGKSGRIDLNLTVNTGFNTATRMPKLMDTRQYLQYRKDAFATDNVTPSPINGGFFVPGYAPDLTIFDQDKYTNWQKLIYGKTSSNTDVHASLSGGTQNNTFLVSAGYTRSNFNFPGSGYADQRLTLHSSIHHTSTDNRLTLDFGSDFGYDQNNSPGYGGSQGVLLPPNLPDLLDAEGDLVWSYKGADLRGQQFYSYLKKTVGLQNYNFNNTFRITYRVLPGLSISANAGYSRNTSNGRSENPVSSQAPAYASSEVYFTNNIYQTINVEPQIDYSCVLGKGMLTALLGGTYKKNTNYQNTLEGSGFANDNFLGSINGAASIYSFDDMDIYKYSAGFARLKYVYNQKYILSLTGRRDGSSNFGPGHQFGDFGSVGAGWIFSEEKVFKKALPFISYAKISGNYGTSGSDGIKSYQYQAFWQPLGYLPAFQGAQPDVPVNLLNPNYGWALKKSLNTSLDFGFFHDRLLLNATYYRGREGNQLGGYPLSAQVGLPSVLENLPASIQNSGWEFSLNSTNVKTKDFSWNSNFNISFNRNKVLSFPNLSSSSYNYLYVIGQPTSIILGYRFKGLNSATGLFEYYDKDGKTTNSPKYGLVANGGDEVPIADREVKYMGGLANTFTYKHFSLYIFFQFASQTAPNYLSTIYSSYTPGVTLGNLPVQALDYWKKPGDQTTLQRLSVSYTSAATNGAGSFASSTAAYSDDTYLRLKTMSLSYSLPPTLLRRIHIHDCRIFVNAQNLLTFTDYKVGDPELFNDFTAVPLQRIVAFGLNFNF